MAKDNEKNNEVESDRTAQKSGADASEQERETLSFDDLPLDEYGQENTIKHASISKKTKAIITILLLCMVAVIVVAGWQNLSPDRLAGSVEKNLMGNDGTGFPASITGSKINNGNIKLWDKNLAYVSDTSFVVLNNNGAKVSDRQISFASPTVITKGNYSMIYNLGGAGFEIGTMGDTIFKSEDKNSILAADINTHGMYAAITNTSGYLGKLTVYNTDNTQNYAYYFADYYPNSVSINEDGTMAVVSGVSSKEGVLKSVLYVLDFKSKEPKALLEFDDNLVYTVSFMDNGNIAAIGDNAAVMVKSNLTDKQSYHYNKLMLTAYDIDVHNGIAFSLSRSGDGYSCNLVYMNKNGDANEPVGTDLKITSISMYGDRIGVLSGEEIRTFYKNGTEAAKTDAGVDAKAICMESESSAYILGISEIRFKRF